ncbi:MAG: aminotransferase class I/II-fold pyridoxal phosphate-dependent enzyme [Planctomycetia bacterium]|nr:aminotransferase class I/II-fold pyridoxal phosphate-dependent enzyme [Planctomycetia bacterium]
MSDRPDDICPRPDFSPLPQGTQPTSPPIHLASVYRCEEPEQARAILAGEQAGYVYSRDGHPNADQLAAKCRELHGAARAAICGSGMSALSAALLALVRQGDHLVVSNQLYGQSAHLLTNEAARLGIESTVVDTCDLSATVAAFRPRTKLVVVETITNPLLRVCDVRALAELAHSKGAKLLVDNTFAGPTVCRPIELGADLVLESLTKFMSGHSDVLLGLLCGREEAFERVPGVIRAWGLTGGPFDCWLALRGLSTLAVRAERACHNALQLAGHLATRKLAAVHYPGLPSHQDHEVARRQFLGQFGTTVTFTLEGGLEAARRFILAAKDIPFCPSLGDVSTTLSHPASTSHRRLPAAKREKLGIFDGTIRLSVGIESIEAIVRSLDEGLAARS